MSLQSPVCSRSNQSTGILAVSALSNFGRGWPIAMSRPVLEQCGQSKESLHCSDQFKDSMANLRSLCTVPYNFGTMWPIQGVSALSCTILGQCDQSKESLHCPVQFWDSVTNPKSLCTVLTSFGTVRPIVKNAIFPCFKTFDKTMKK